MNFGVGSADVDASINGTAISPLSITVTGAGAPCVSAGPLTVDCLNKRVGIGDATPNDELDILSNVAPTAFILGVSSQADAVEAGIFSILGNGNIGIATNTPTGLLTVWTSTVAVSISTNGYLGSTGGGPPTFSGCGTTPTIATGSNNLRGSLVMTSGLSSSCTMTPAVPAPSNYFCTFSGGGAGTAVFFQQSANLTVACDNATGLVTCGVGTFVSWTCSGTN